jgi:hypothetical protein
VLLVFPSQVPFLLDLSEEQKEHYAKGLLETMGKEGWTVADLAVEDDAVRAQYVAMRRA